MIIFENKGFQTRSDKPNEDFSGNALYVVCDTSEIATKITKFFPYYDFVLDKNGKLIDVLQTEVQEEKENEVNQHI